MNDNVFDTPYGKASYHIDPKNNFCVVTYFVNTEHDPTKIKLDQMFPELRGWKRGLGKIQLDERFIQPYGTRLLFKFPIIADQ